MQSFPELEYTHFYKKGKDIIRSGTAPSASYTRIYDGTYNYKENKIYISYGLSTKEEFCVFYHEVTHYLFGRNEALPYTVENMLRIIVGLEPKTHISLTN